ncbi:hypothetical protein LTS15_009148 [Exophiala xenobiotica]|nr:hypothetical protein LTS15_009148 [Exophiala xenobiotica]
MDCGGTDYIGPFTPIARSGARYIVVYKDYFRLSRRRHPDYKFDADLSDPTGDPGHCNRITCKGSASPVVLCPWQIIAIVTQLQHEPRWGGGCDALDCGMGKTIKALAMVHYRALSLDVKKAAHEDVDERPTLVLAPSSVIGEWFRELTKFFDGILQFHMFYSSETEKWEPQLRDHVLPSDPLLVRQKISATSKQLQILGLSNLTRIAIYRRAATKFDIFKAACTIRVAWKTIAPPKLRRTTLPGGARKRKKAEKVERVWYGKH